MLRKPRELKRTNTSCLFLSAIGTAFFLVSLMLASFGPNLNATYRGLTLIHALHPFLFFAMIFINGGILEVSYLIVFCGMYILCWLADWIGNIVKIYYLSTCTDCSNTELGFMWAGIAVDILMGVISTVQIGVTVYISKLTMKHFSAIEKLEEIIAKTIDIPIDDIPGGDKEIKRAEKRIRRTHKRNKSGDEETETIDVLKNEKEASQQNPTKVKTKATSIIEETSAKTDIDPTGEQVTKKKIEIKEEIASGNVNSDIAGTSSFMTVSRLRTKLPTLNETQADEEIL